MITMKDLQELTVTQLKDTKVLIDTIVKTKLKRENDFCPSDACS